MTFQKGHKINVGRKIKPSQGFQKGNKIGPRFKKGHKVLSNWGFQKGKNNPRWNGGIRKHSDGYILIYRPEHPFCNSQGYIMEHRFIVEQYLGRYLTPQEEVHHINEIKNDNRIENFMLFKNRGYHKAFHKFGKCLYIIKNP